MRIIEPRLTRWWGCLVTAYLSATLAISLLLLSGPEATARQQWNVLHAALPSHSLDGFSNAIAQDAVDVRVLVSGASIERELEGGSHSYSITLVSGQYLRVVVNQQSVNVVVKVFRPGGQQIAEVNNTSDQQESEQISLITEGAGDYRLEVHPARKDAASGRYDVRIEDLRAATQQDEVYVAAETALAEGKRLFSQRTGEALRGAAKKCEEALALYRHAGDRRGEVRALNCMSESYIMLGESRKALTTSGEAFPISQSLDDRRLKAHTVRGLAMAYERTDEPQKALEHRLLALWLWRAVGDRHWEASALGGLGVVYSLTDEPQKALEYYSQALAIYRELKNSRGESAMLNNLGELYRDLGEYQKALDHYFQVLSLIQGSQHGRAGVFHNIGNAYHLKAEPRKALEYYQQALSLNQIAGNRALEAEILGRIGVICSDLGDPQKALEYLNRALIISRELGIRLREANITYHIGMTHASVAEKPKALGHFRKALSLSRSVGNRSLEATTLYGIARVERDDGNLIEARAKMDAALEIVESLRSKIARQELRTSYFASQQNYYEFYTDLLMRLHHNDPSGGHDAAALEIGERARARSLLDALAETRADVRQGVAPALLEREHALRRQLNLKAERLRNLLNDKHTEGQAVAARKQLESVLTEYQQLQAQIRTSSPRYAALTQPQPLTVNEIQRELDQDSLLLEYSLGKERSFLWAVTPTSIKSYVLPRQAEIETAARRVYELVNARNQHPAGEAPERRATRVDEADAEYAEAAAALSQMLLGPVATQLGTKRLIIVGEGALQYVPLGALPAPHADMTRRIQGETETRGREDMRSQKAPDRRGVVSPSPRVPFVPLTAKHEIVTLPSASVLAVLRRELKDRTSAPEAVAVLADPVFRSDDPRIRDADKQERGNTANGNGAGVSPARRYASQTDLESSAKESGVTEFNRLRFSRQEAEAITAIAPGGKSLKAIDFAANRATATSLELSRYRVLHFATHGLLNSQHPELSGIVLSLVDERGHPQDGFLRLHEIYNLKLGADLVVLSACQTALGKEIKGEGLIGLTRGFMYAGVPRVVSSLWNVDDRATAELMKRFYEAMFIQGMRPAAALRAAQTSLRREKGWAAPYYWAGFTLQGEWR